MPLQDLSQATLALQRLLQFNIPLLEPGLGALTITTLPPERVQGDVNVLSLYCYHVSPDGSNRFRPRQPTGARPIATSPLTLNLNYILTAHTVVNSEFNAMAEQRLLGYAMKTLHDYPVLDDNTNVGGQIVLPGEIRGQRNSFSITQLQLTPGEALNYWANEHEITVKPSCYYEVSAAEIAPDPPARLSGIVLSVGSFVMPKDSPAISSSVSDVPYVLPASVGGGPASLTATPARLGPVTAAPPPVNVMRLTGRAFTAGAAQTLVLSHPFWARQFTAGRVPLDLTLNGALGWALAITTSEITITAGDVLRAALPAGGGNIDLELYPGVYTATWDIERRFEAHGTTDRISERSNACAFTVRPHITAAARDGGTGRVTLNFGGAWLMTRGRPVPPDPTTAPELEILLSVDGQAYTLVAGANPTGPGTFSIADHALTYEPTPEADTVGEHAVRVVVDGADAQPFWITIP